MAGFYPYRVGRMMLIGTANITVPLNDVFLQQFLDTNDRVFYTSRGSKEACIRRLPDVNERRERNGFTKVINVSYG